MTASRTPTTEPCAFFSTGVAGSSPTPRHDRSDEEIQEGQEGRTPPASGVARGGRTARVDRPPRTRRTPRTPFAAFVALFGLASAAGCSGLLDGSDPSDRESGGASAEELGQDAPRVVAEGLEAPWEIRFLPDGDLLVTERPGRVVRLTEDGERVRSDPVPGVVSQSESGLMGLALDPAFAETGRIYLCYTTRSGDALSNRVDRFVYGPDGLSSGAPILQGMRGAPFHDGCRLEFGPDGFLHVTMGDAGDGEAAQDTERLNGKILRITTDGDRAPGNPFGNPVHSYGHRNSQGLAFDDSGRLWSTDHGPSGFRSGYDEVNLTIRGNNYGWPEVQGDESASGMVGPVVHSGSGTWAPAGLAWLEGSLFFGGLRGEALYQIEVPADAISPTAGSTLRLEVVSHLQGEYGRIRAVRSGPDGLLYFGTSNRDGRGNVREGDDRILAVDPVALSENR